MAWLSALVSLLSGVIGAVVGGFVVHRFTLRREILSAQRTQRVAFLLDTYRRLSDVSNNGSGMTQQQERDLESSLRDIMLLGDSDEIAAAHRFIVDFAQNREGILDPVIVALRNNLRRELGVAPVPLPKAYVIRITRE